MWRGQTTVIWQQALFRRYYKWQLSQLAALGLLTLLQCFIFYYFSPYFSLDSTFYNVYLFIDWLIFIYLFTFFTQYARILAAPHIKVGGNRPRAQEKPATISAVARAQSGVLLIVARRQQVDRCFLVPRENYGQRGTQTSPRWLSRIPRQRT